MFASNDFGDDNNVFFQFSPTFLNHEDSCFQFLPPPPQVAETLNVDKCVSSNANAGGSGKKVTGISGRTPRKRSGKKDRHSKIVTAQGTRDRRMRLSLEIARKFFNLQDMLGFDKASKTVDWLLRKSKEAINDLSKGCSGENRSASSISDCDVVGEVNEGFFKGKSSSGNVSKKQKKVKKSSCDTAFHQLVRDSRARARERARERTIEKKRRLDKSKQCFVQVNPHDLKSSSPDETRGGSQNTFMEVLTTEYEEPSVSHPPKHPAPNKDAANKSPLSINSPATRFNSQNNFAIPQGVCFNNTSIPNFQETWCTDIAKVHTTYCANGSLGNAQNPLSGSIFLSASDFRLQSQFLNINQFYAKPW